MGTSWGVQDVPNGLYRVLEPGWEGFGLKPEGRESLIGSDNLMCASVMAPAGSHRRRL